MALTLATATQNALASTLAARYDLGAAAATIKVYSGVRPANANTAPGGGNVLLLTFTMDVTAFTGPASGVLTLAGLPKSATGAAVGIASWFRAADSDGNTVHDGSVGADGSGEDIELSTTSITTGLVVNMNSGTLTQPAS